MYNFTLYMTTDCNFKCQYCYEDYHNHYQLNEKHLWTLWSLWWIMGIEGKSWLIFWAVSLCWRKDLIYKAVAYIKDNYPEREVKYYITTNCSMMDDRFIAIYERKIILQYALVLMGIRKPMIWTELRKMEFLAMKKFLRISWR